MKVLHSADYNTIF